MHTYESIKQIVPQTPETAGREFIHTQSQGLLVPPPPSTPSTLVLRTDNGFHSLTKRGGNVIIGNTATELALEPDHAGSTRPNSFKSLSEIPQE